MFIKSERRIMAGRVVVTGFGDFFATANAAFVLVTISDITIENGLRPGNGYLSSH
jgi:hypothetical protein